MADSRARGRRRVVHGPDALHAQIINHLKEAAGLELSAAELFDNPTPAALARHLATTAAHRNGEAGS